MIKYCICGYTVLVTPDGTILDSKEQPTSVCPLCGIAWNGVDGLEDLPVQYGETGLNVKKIIGENNGI